MKKLLICLTLFFSFLFIDNIKAWTYLPDFEYNEAIYNKVNNLTEENIYKLLENNGYNPDDYYYIAMYTDGSNFSNASYNTFAILYYPKNSKLNMSVTDTSSGAKFSFNGSNGLCPFYTNNHTSNTITLDTSAKINSSGYNMYLNNVSYLWYLSNNDVNDYIHDTSNKIYNINFHLNGGIVTDLSDILNPIIYENDYTKSFENDDFINYINSITPMKSNSSFIGWYYDENFTQPFNITDTITSDINLYAKFSLNPTIYFHLNNGYIEDYSITNEEIKEIKDNMCELANCTQYDSYATNPYNQMLSGITSAKIDLFLSNHYTSNNQEFRNLAMKLVNEDYTKPTYYNEDYSKQLSPNNIKNYITNITPKRMFQTFVGWYYDKALTQPYKIDDIITNDTHLYAKWRHNNVNEFLNNTTFIDYTFDTNFEYAIITRGSNTGDIYLGLGHMINNLELYEYDQNNFLYLNGASLCLTPYYSKDNMYYYLMESELYNNIEVLVIPKSKLENQGSTFYDFKLSNNAYVTYTNDLTKVEIYDDNNNKIETNLSDSYNYSQDALLNDKDVVSIFKDLFKFKDNKVFQHFNQMWNLFRKSELYNYFIILIIGSLIVLIIKAAKRM